MPKFRKKPVVIEAEQWRRLGDVPDVREPTPEEIDQWQLLPRIYEGEGPFGALDTLEGAYVVSPGDWIITGVKGEKYPCKPDIFAETYEPVEDDSYAHEHELRSTWG
jgi:hypothetical protein